MNVIDFFIAVTVLLGLYRGFAVGAVKTVMSLVVWLGALVLATILAKPLSVMFVGVVDGDVLQTASAFLAVVFAVVIVGHVLIWVILKTLKVLRLGLLDKVLGGVLGSAKGLLKVLIVLSVTSPLLVTMPSWQDAKLAHSLMPFAPIAKELVVEALGQAWREVQTLQESQDF